MASDKKHLTDTSLREEAITQGYLREFNPCPEREPFSLTIHNMQVLVERMHLVLDSLHGGETPGQVTGGCSDMTTGIHYWPA
jgi:hypothetical protein